MARQPLKFRESDLRRAMRAAHHEAATFGACAVEIDPRDGKIRIVPLTKLAKPEEANPWDK